jgi:hypothetical protein
MANAIRFYSAGYGRWPADRRWTSFVEAVRSAGVTLVVDIRHSPCPSQLDPANPYGPRAWHVRPGGVGIAAGLRAAGVGYLWAVELGNPQKTDPAMAVLREHLADPGGNWPVHRGLDLAARLVADPEARCCLLCACAKYADCHRKPVAEALLARLPPDAEHRDLTG